MTKAAVPSILIAVMLLAVQVIAEPQQAGKVHRVGFLTGGFPAPESFGSDSVRRELRRARLSRG